MSGWTKALLASVVAATLIVPSVAVAKEEPGEQRSRNQARHRKAHCGDKSVGLLGRQVVHAELKVKNKDGFSDLVVDAGRLTAAGGDSLTLKRADTEVVSATKADGTKVCRDGKKVEFGELKTGDFARIVTDKGGALKAVMARSEERGEKRKRG